MGRLLQRERVIEGHRSEPDAVAGLGLTDLPQLSFGDRSRADEAAEARSVAGQNDRHVAGEIDRADRVFAVMNIGWMQQDQAIADLAPLEAFSASEMPNLEPLTTISASVLAALVAQFSQIDGYRCLSLMRASGVVKCQLALA